MGDRPNENRDQPDASRKVPERQTPENQGEMSDADLEKVSGGVTMQDFSFTKKVDKTSPT